MRRLTTYLLALPLAAAGSLVAHQLAYLSSAQPRSAWSSSLVATGHGWMRHWPMIVAGLAATAAVGLFAEIRRAMRGDSAYSLTVWPLALIAPASFVLQEVVERLVHGTLTAGSFRTSTFVLGLILQFPFAVFTWRIARAVVTTVRRVAAAWRQRPRVVVAARPVARPVPTASGRRRCIALLRAAPGRAPPAALLSH